MNSSVPRTKSLRYRNEILTAELQQLSQGGAGCKENLLAYLKLKARWVGGRTATKLSKLLLLLVAGWFDPLALQGSHAYCCSPVEETKAFKGEVTCLEPHSEAVAWLGFLPTRKPGFLQDALLTERRATTCWERGSRKQGGGWARGLPLSVPPPLQDPQDPSPESQR